MGIEPTNDGYEPPAITILAIQSLLLVPFCLRSEYIIRVGLEPTTQRLGSPVLPSELPDVFDKTLSFIIIKGVSPFVGLPRKQVLLR